MEFFHGGDIYRNKIEYDFSANINPLGMPEGCEKAVERAVAHIGEYPDYQGAALCEVIAKAEGVKREQVIPGNGAAELIYALCHAIGVKKGVSAAPAFTEYENAVIAAGGKMLFWNLHEDTGFQLDGQVDAFLDMIGGDTDLIFLCNPNNPTGVTVSKGPLEMIAEECGKNGVYLCVDECFLPFLEQEERYTMKHELEKYPHVIVLRAFTKIYGMPGLRLGYALSGNPWLTERLWRCLPPWNTSIIAQAAGIEAMGDKAFIKRTQELIKKEKQFLIKELQNGLTEKIYPSLANFIFFRSRADLKERLLEKKILIRDCSNYRNLEAGYFRIAVRGHLENQELIRRWREL